MMMSKWFCAFKGFVFCCQSTVFCFSRHAKTEETESKKARVVWVDPAASQIIERQHADDESIMYFIDVGETGGDGDNIFSISY